MLCAASAVCIPVANIRTMELSMLFFHSHALTNTHTLDNSQIKHYPVFITFGHFGTFPTYCLSIFLCRNIIKPRIASYLETMNLSIDRTTFLAIMIPMIALLFIGFISYENTIQFIQHDVIDEKINLIIQRLEHLVSDVTDAETGQRGYIITDAPNYLQPYNYALRDIRGQLGNLNMMIVNEPFNQKLSLNDLNILKGLIEAKLAELNQTIALRQSHGFNAVLPIILSNRGKIVMDNIRATALDIENQQKNLLAMYTNRSEAYAQNTIYTIIVTTLVAAGIIGVSVFVIKLGIQKRHLAIQRSLQNEVKQRTEELQIANDQLLITNKRLEVHDRLQHDFINVAAHELRTPIQPILGLSQILRTKSKDSMFTDSLDIIIRNAIRLQRLTEDILDVQKIESHTLQLKKVRIDLNILISDLVADCRKQLLKENKESITLLTELNFSKPIILYVDRDRLARVIDNLLNNSIKFTKEGSIVTAVKEREDQQRNEVIISVKDTGSGIDLDILPKLFSKFVTKSYHGTGLGLYICKAIVEAHGGKIWAENNVVGKGATFSFSLPIAENIIQ
jgi:signal transduction histidine kinase